MGESDVFAVLSPCRNRYWVNTIRAFSHQHNTIWIDTEPIDSRAPTPALSPSPESEDDSPNRLVLKFEHLRHVNEIQVGTNPEVCQILLKFPGAKGISARQYAIVVQANNSVCLVDRFSTWGTQVMHDGKEEQRRKGEWILAGPPMHGKRSEEVVICTGNVACKIEFPNHDSGSSEYLKKLQAFRERESTPLFGALDLHSKPITVQPSHFSPRRKKGMGYVNHGQIAKSNFGTVEMITGTTDKKCYVKKTILRYPRADKVERDDITGMTPYETWINNFRHRMHVLEIINHPNILRVVEYGEDPDPYYITDYFELGSLEDLSENGLREDLLPKFLLQILLALREFHRLGYVHRDVKEANILVDRNLNLVLSDPDFLKSAKDNFLTTICGSMLYAAPEIFREDHKPYGKTVDIWAAAICILRAFGLLQDPSHEIGINRKTWNRTWCRNLLKQVHELDENNDQIMGILKHMLEYNADKRFTVDQCLRMGCENGLFKERGDGEIVLSEATEVNTRINTPASFNLDDGEETPKPRSPLANPSDDELSTSVDSLLPLKACDNPIPTIEHSEESSCHGMCQNVASPFINSRGGKRSAESPEPLESPESPDPPSIIELDARRSNLDTVNHASVVDDELWETRATRRTSNKRPTTGSTSSSSRMRQRRRRSSMAQHVLHATYNHTHDSGQEINSDVEAEGASKDQVEGLEATRKASQARHLEFQRTEESGALASKWSLEVSREGFSTNSKAPSYITEWEGTPHLQPFSRSEALEEIPPQKLDANQPSQRFQGTLVQSTTRSQDAQTNLNLCPAPQSLSQSASASPGIPAQVNRAEWQKRLNYTGRDELKEIGQCHAAIETWNPVPPNSRQPGQDDVGDRNGPTAESHKVSRRQPTKRFLLLSTIYGPVHLLEEDSRLLVNATNIAVIFGHNRILPFKDRPSPVLQLTRELDTRLHGLYYTLEDALQFCNILSANTNTRQANNAIGGALKEMLQRGVENHRSGRQKLPVKSLDRKNVRPRCQRCARLHTTCNREVPCQKCAHTSHECVYNS